MQTIPDLVRAVKVECIGICTKGEVVSREEYQNRKFDFIFGYTANDGNYYTESCAAFNLREPEIGSEYTVIYDENNPKMMGVKKYTLFARIVQFIIGLMLMAITLVPTIYIIYNTR